MTAGKKWAFAALLVLVTLAAYWPALRGGFIWSDESFLTKNEMMRAGNGLYRFWFTTQPADYWPMTATSFWTEWRLWGENPLGYHATNIVLHIGESLLLWSVLRRLEIRGAAVAALLFAVHPVNVQSVAWIVERKNLLAMLFYLLAILLFLKTGFASSRTPDSSREFETAKHPWIWQAGSVAAFALAMLSKGSVALLPLVLAGLIASRRRLELRDGMRLAPFFLVGASLVWVDIWFQQHRLSDAIRSAGWLERLLGAGAVVWFYLGKALMPLNLIFIYPQWQIRPNDPRWWLPLAGAVLTTALLGRAVRHPWARAALLTWCYFCVSLVPAMGFTDVYFMRYSLVGDHYQHLALIGVTAFAGWAWAQWRATAGIRLTAVTLVIGALGILTWRQCRLYRDAETLFSATIERNPGSWMARNNLGIILAGSGRVHQAIGDFQEATRQAPGNSDVRFNLAVALSLAGRLTEAIGQFQETVRLAPQDLNARIDLGDALASAWRFSEAEVQYRAALQIAPRSAMANLNLGNLLSRQGRFAAAIPYYEAGLRSTPDNPAIHHNLALALAVVDRNDEAEAHFRREAELDAPAGQMKPPAGK